MNPSAQAESVRTIVESTVSGWGVSDARLRMFQVTEIVRNGRAIGRRYEIDGIRAIWLWDRDVIIFSGRNRQLLKTVSVSDALPACANVA